MAVGYVLTAVLNVDIITAMVIGLGVLGFYSVAGGIIAGVYTDLFQGVIMMVAAVCVCYYAIVSAGGMSEMSRTLWD
jgi:Na+/pantothenate symporter